MCAEGHGVPEELAGLSQVAALNFSRCWMSCGGEEERWAARRKGGMAAVHPCWHLTNGKMSRKRNLRCAMRVSSQQKMRGGLGTSDVFSELSE